MFLIFVVLVIIELLGQLKVHFCYRIKLQVQKIYPVLFHLRKLKVKQKWGPMKRRIQRRRGN
jgi:hypothetical protein